VPNEFLGTGLAVVDGWIVTVALPSAALDLLA
jgi:hypothetical protein